MQRSFLAWFLLSIVLAVLLSACSSGKDNTYPPVPLKEISVEIKLERQWQNKIGNGTAKQFLRLQPYVDKATVYAVANNGKLVAIDNPSGKKLWKIDTENKIIAGVSGNEAGLIIGSLSGTVAAYSKTTGDKLWNISLSSEVMSLSQSSQGQLIARTKDGAIAAINSSTGKINWQVNRQVPVLSLQSQSDSLIIKDRVVAGLDNGHLLVMSLDTGNVIWEKAVATGRGRTELDRMVDIDGKLAFLDGVIYVVSYQGNIAAFSLADGNRIWSRNASSINGLVVSSSHVYYTDSKSFIWALDKSSGNVLWKQEGLERRKVTAPVLYKGNLVVGDFEGYLHLLSADDGHFLGRNRTGKSAIIVSPVVADEKLYVYDIRGSLSSWAIKTKK